MDEYIVSEKMTDEKELLPEYQNGPTEVSNPIQKEMIKRMISIVKEIEKSAFQESPSGDER